MNSFFSLITLNLLVIAGTPVQAQMGLEGFSTGRYEVHKTKPRKPASEETTDEKNKSAALKNSVKKTEETVEKKNQQSESKPQVDSEQLTKSDLSQTATTQNDPVEEPSIQEQAQSLISNKPEHIYDFYREKISADDDRNNRAQLDVTPVVAYIDSQSNYSYRNYQSFFNGLKLKANVWITPRIGVTGQIMFSLAADIDSIGADKSRLPAKHEFVDLGVNFRTFFDSTLRSKSMEFLVLYTENKMTVPIDSTARTRLKSQGIGAGIKMRVPISDTYAWTLGTNFFPRVLHSELETGAAIKSGSAEESVRVGIDVGGEWRLNRKNQIIWGLAANVERNIFDGAAESIDPETGLTPSNVSVTNALYLFSLGYRWGH